MMMIDDDDNNDYTFKLFPPICFLADLETFLLLMF